MEGAHFIATGELIKLSEQQFVDCDKNCYGCGGGLEIYAFDYANKNPLELETDYTYKGKNNHCVANKAKELVQALSHAQVTPRSVSGLKAAVAAGPTCVSVNAGDTHFMYYNGGVLVAPSCGTNLDHAVTAVGYGVENGVEYLIVRNSWGTGWGEDGYIRMAFGDDGSHGTCGVMLDSNTVVTN